MFHNHRNQSKGLNWFSGSFKTPCWGGIDYWLGCLDPRIYLLLLWSCLYCHPAYLTYMQSTSWETLGWKKHKLESRFPGEKSITSDTQWHHLYGRKWRGTKKPLDESERGSEKIGLKLDIQKIKIMASGTITSWQIDGETVEIVSDFTFLGSKSLQMVTAAMKLKDAYSLEGKLWPT